MRIESTRRLKAVVIYKISIVGIPKVFWYGIEADYNIMAMEFLGPSLEALFSYCKRRLCLKTVVLISLQLVHLTLISRSRELNIYIPNRSFIEM